MRWYDFRFRRLRLPVWLGLFGLTILTILLTPALAQITGSINGTVVDTTQAAVPGARLVLMNTQTGDSRQLTSSEQGFFTFTDLQRGEYTIKVNAQCFRELSIGPLVLTVGQQMTVYPRLDLGTLSESVEVQGTPPPVTTSS